MDWEMIAPMIFAVILTLTIGGVVLLRPIAKRLGDIVELMLRDKHHGIESEVGRMTDLLETINARMVLMEERQDFTERLLASPERSKKPDASQ